MAGLKDLKTSTFKSVELDRIAPKATNSSDFINNAEGETSAFKAPARTGAPKKNQADKRAQKVMIYFTEREIVKLKEMAEEKSMKMTEFIRFKIFCS